MESVNPCCSKWVKAYKKLEGKRNALRNGVEILQKQIDLLQQDNASLKKACDEERARVNVVEKEKGEEASLRISMEKEIAALKSETSSIGPQATFGNAGLDNEATHLRTCISEKEMEIDRLKQLLADEITRVNVEKNAAELERKNVAELQRSLEYEKRKAEEASKMSDAAARKAEDHRIQLETLRNELEKTNLKWVEVNRKLEAEKQDAIKEKRCSDEKRVQEEECRANYFTQLEEEKQKVEKLQNELQEIMRLKSSVDTSELDEVKRKLEAEKNEVAKEKRRVAEEKVKVSEQRKIAEACEKRVSEEKCRADEFMRQFEEEKQKVENLRRELQEVLSSQKATDFSQFDELKKNLEEERKKVVEEQKCVEEEKARVMEQRKIADANKQRASEEKYRADNLFIQLEEEKRKVEKLQRELQEALLSRITIDSSDFHELKRNLEEEKKKVAQEQRCVEEEKVRTMEQKKIADANKKRFSEEKCHNDKLLMELEEEKRKVEELQRELQEGLPSQKAIDSCVFDELKRNLEEEKKKVTQGERCVEEEKVRAIEQKKIADANKKVASEEKSRADKLLVLLEEEKRKVDKLQRELQEVVSSKKPAKSSELDEVNRNLEAEKKKVAIERKRGDLETSRKEEQKNLAEASIKNAMEEKSRADKLFEELVSSREMIKNLERELNKVNGMLKSERIEVAREKTRADLQKLKSEEQGQIAVTNKMRAMEEKSRGDNLFQELLNARKQLQDVEHELDEVKLCRGLNRTSVVAPIAVNEQAARVTLLQEQLKFEKKRVKHAKEVAKLEKDRNIILQQELKRLKQDFQCLLDHLGMLSDTFGTRNGVANILKKSGLPQMRYHGDDELRMSSLSSKDASCRFKPNMRLVQAGPGMESTSASFSYEQLLGSQERVAGSLNMSAGLSVENPKQRATILRDSNECYKGKTGDKICIAGEHSIRSPVEAVTDHAKKRRKILDEIESIKHMHLEGKSIFQEAEKKLLTLQNTLLQPLMNDQLEKENFSLPVNKNKLCGNSDWSSKKRKILRESDLVFRQANDPNVEMEVDKTFAPSATETREISQPSTDLEIDRVEHIQDTMTDFEQVINGDYMKLLDLDDAVAEECFKMAMERPLSPIPPELLEFGQKARALTLSEPISRDNEAEHQAYNENQLYFVLFTDLEDVSSITQIYGATRACLARCLFFQTDFSLQDILMALLLEKDLRPREKACVLFSLILLNFSAVSSSKPVNFCIQELMDSFSANIHSVLFNSETRDLFAKICDLRELLTLSEDFMLNRRTMSNFMTCELLGGCGSSVEILLEGKKIVLWPKMASTDLVVAGSIVFASVSKAVGHTGYVCEVSLKFLQIDRAEYSLALKVLHSFARVCGEEYFSISNYSSVMNVVRSVVTFMEGTIAKNAIQPGDNSQNQFTPCVRCPFSEGSVSVDVVSSELLEELQSHIVPQDPVVSAHPSNREALNCLLGDVLSSLELISSFMGWDWVCDKIVPKLYKMLESSYQDRVFTTALVVLLGDIGRLGVKARGYDDTGIEGIKRHLLGLLYQTAASKCDTTLSMAIVYGLIGLYPKGLEMFQKGNNFELPAEGSHSASSSFDIVSKFLSSLSSKQITSLVSLVNPDNRCS
ncbi:nucleoprotein TPR-like isoform X2 [Chenopodium quinoa]|uniref:nucleoprotein TPR-like isoform X2 n=1 Tax=Chenopodium quinoa TaxID=63459 RepID=UPI000B7780EF|nr:nucleoprotein TPR-like isoform X2 [Chenopodium quinoa]